MLPIQNFTVFVTMSEKLFFFADDDDAELLLQDAWWQPQQVLRLQGEDP